MHWTPTKEKRVFLKNREEESQVTLGVGTRVRIIDKVIFLDIYIFLFEQSL